MFKTVSAYPPRVQTIIVNMIVPAETIALFIKGLLTPSPSSRNLLSISTPDDSESSDSVSWSLLSLSKFQIWS